MKSSKSQQISVQILSGFLLLSLVFALGVGLQGVRAQDAQADAVTLTPTSSQTATVTGTSTPTLTPTATGTATVTGTSTPTITPQPTATNTNTSTPTNTQLQEPEPPETETPTPSVTPTENLTTTNTITPIVSSNNNTSSLYDVVLSKVRDNFPDSARKEVVISDTEQHGGWAFGIVVIISSPEEEPDLLLFIGNKDENNWHVALEATQLFYAWLTEMPEILVSSEAKFYLGSTARRKSFCSLYALVEDHRLC